MELPELTGRIQNPPNPADQAKRIEELEEELAASQEEVEELREATLRLAKLLTPVYRALQAAIGGDDVRITQDVQVDVASGDRSSEFWDKWKQKLGGKSAEIIDVLIGHPGMTTQSVRIAANCGFSTASTLLNKLKDMNLVRKYGGRWVLKSL
jgi:hypothetical protein